MLAAFHYYNKIIELIKRKNGMFYFIVKEISVHVHLTLLRWSMVAWSITAGTWKTCKPFTSWLT